MCVVVFFTGLGDSVAAMSCSSASCSFSRLLLLINVECHKCVLLERWFYVGEGGGCAVFAVLAVEQRGGFMSVLCWTLCSSWIAFSFASSGLKAVVIEVRGRKA